MSLQAQAQDPNSITLLNECLKIYIKQPNFETGHHKAANYVQKMTSEYPNLHSEHQKKKKTTKPPRTILEDMFKT